ncbi:MAG: prolyl oligopeptidase family serine peptidase, partial [Candidatus Tectomicrobia bacterium]|nr:prolyl oligopeptidase family serine peptidase [Candidatus Tectomicrobia bacterium]
PTDIYWSDDGAWIYFRWNPEQDDSASLYVVSRQGGTPRKLTLEERRKLPARTGHYNCTRTQKVYEKYGDIFLLDIPSGRIRTVTTTVAKESHPRFTHDEKKITFMVHNNLYRWRIDTGETVQLTDFRVGRKQQEEEEPRTKQEQWLRSRERKLIRVLQARQDRKERAERRRMDEEPARPKAIYIEDKNVQNVQLSPDERYITFRLVKEPEETKPTIVPTYVTDSGYTGGLPARRKVGSPQRSSAFGIYDTKERAVSFVTLDDIPGMYDRSVSLETGMANGQNGNNRVAHQQDKVGRREKDATTKVSPRDVMIHGPLWSDDGHLAIVIVLALDHKDRWIASLDLTTGQLRSLDQQHDPAWIGGPDVWGSLQAGTIGWMPDNRRVWFQSEESRYSHLYTIDVLTREKQQLTRGRFEIYRPQLSHDQKYWYFAANEAHPGERHFYRMPIGGGKAVRITQMPGANEVHPSPNGQMLAIRHSASNRPWELYLMENQPEAQPRQVTHSLSAEFVSYPWRQPQIVTFPTRDGKTISARLYRPAHPEHQGPAIIFAHDSGYAQNAHKWWSKHFHDYLFHNFLADHGYTVLDIDYRGSAGYGRDWRAGIYRHMGGKDLTDHIDSARFLIENHDVDARRLGIYGNSYGGFITLMAMFTTPDVFAVGAALQPVTDWAHYDHHYTSAILNLPYEDELAYQRSSPIDHVAGLRGALLICHGMIDTNVHFQDVVRLVQRLIELGKDNWDLAIYPLEGHDFHEPSSWTDAYKRIFKLFETHLK